MQKIRGIAVLTIFMLAGYPARNAMADYVAEVYELVQLQVFSKSDSGEIIYGSPKNEQDFVEKIKEGLKDPYSAHITCLPPVKMWFRVKGGSIDATYGYSSVCDVNAKNVYGAYTGKETSIYFFSGVGVFGRIGSLIIAKNLVEFHTVP